MGIPNKISCPICNNEMGEMEPIEGQDLKLSSVNVKVGEERKYLKTKVFMCKNCNNLQSFIQFEEK